MTKIQSIGQGTTRGARSVDPNPTRTDRRKHHEPEVSTCTSRTDILTYKITALQHMTAHINCSADSPGSSRVQAKNRVHHQPYFPGTNVQVTYIEVIIDVRPTRKASTLKHVHSRMALYVMSNDAQILFSQGSLQQTCIRDKKNLLVGASMTPAPEKRSIAS